MAAGYSQRELGVLAGLDESGASVRVNQYERGVHEPNYLMVRKFGDVLNVPAAYFYAEDAELAEVIRLYFRLSRSGRARILSGLQHS